MTNIIQEIKTMERKISEMEKVTRLQITVLDKGVGALSSTPYTATLSVQRPFCQCVPGLTYSTRIATFYFRGSRMTSFDEAVDLQRLFRLRNKSTATQTRVTVKLRQKECKKLVVTCDIKTFLTTMTQQGYTDMWWKGQLLLRVQLTLESQKEDSVTVHSKDEVITKTSEDTSGKMTSSIHEEEEAAVDHVFGPTQQQEDQQCSEAGTVHLSGPVINEEDKTDTQKLSPRRPPPWVSLSPHYDGTLRALHQELQDFERWVSGSEAELQRRWRPVEDLRRVVAELCAEGRVEATGSLASGLFLPDSDVDVTLLGRWPPTPPPLHALYDALKKKGLARSGTLMLLDKATVPLVKFVHDATGVEVDVSLGNEAAVRAAGLVKELLQRYPGLRTLSLVVRCYLRGLGLSEVYRGGVSSYAVTLMATSFMQLQVRRQDHANLGLLTVRFFQFYGYTFKYRSRGISVLGGGRYLQKEELPIVMPGGHRRADLCIQDPITPTNDVGRSSYRIWAVQRAFQHAFQVLAPAVYERGTYASPGSLLGQLLAGQDTPTRVMGAGLQEQQRLHSEEDRRLTTRGRGRRHRHVHDEQHAHRLPASTNANNSC